MHMPHCGPTAPLSHQKSSTHAARRALPKALWVQKSASWNEELGTHRDKPRFGFCLGFYVCSVLFLNTQVNYTDLLSSKPDKADLNSQKLFFFNQLIT